MFFGSKSTENKVRFEEKLHLTGKSKKFQIKMWCQVKSLKINNRWEAKKEVHLRNKPKQRYVTKDNCLIEEHEERQMNYLRNENCRGIWRWCQWKSLGHLVVVRKRKQFR